MNQIGGHDQLVFDGASFVVDPDAGAVFEAKTFEPHIATLTLRGPTFGAHYPDPNLFDAKFD